MRFSANGYYIERYVKCANCGMLIYDEGIKGQRHGKDCVYCSDWCIEWRRQVRQRGRLFPICRSPAPEASPRASRRPTR